MKEYYIDFSCWKVRAESEHEAKQLALKYIKEQSMCPEICSMEETGDEIDDDASKGLLNVEHESFCTKGYTREGL